MKVLFVMRSPIYLRNFEQPIRLLAERGHRVQIAFEGHKQGLQDELSLADSLAEDDPKISYSFLPEPRLGRRDRIAFQSRLARNYLRYSHPRYTNAPKLRARANKLKPPFIKKIDVVLKYRPAVVILDFILKALEAITPPNKQVYRYVKDIRPDLLAVTPLVDFDSTQVDYVRSAGGLGIPTALCVFSWDNLTSKGFIYGWPDRVILWNNDQSKEAQQLHGVAKDRIVVTGSPAYDHWFEWKPSRSRDEFHKQAGIPTQSKFVLYLCSSSFIAPRETEFIRTWINTLRNLSETARDVWVLIRPHPMNTKSWRDVDFSSLEKFAVFPQGGADPHDLQTRSDYYDSIYYSSLVMGINTSSLIESAVVGKPVHTLLAPEFKETQQGTLHFDYLAREENGLLRVGQDWDEHIRQVDHSLSEESYDDSRTKAFLTRFVRPHGVDIAASPLFADSLEDLVSRQGNKRSLLERAGRLTSRIANYI